MASITAAAPARLWPWALRRKNINLKKLRNFCKVVEVGNLTKAAEQLHIAQPALGQQMRQLEESLNVPLLIRHSRGVAPTEAGSLLFERALKIMQLISDTEQEVARLGGATQEIVTLGLTPSITLVLGSELLIQARERIPGVFLSLVEDVSYELEEAMAEGKLDLALAYEVGERPGLSRTAVLDEDLLFLTAPQLSDSEEPISFAEAMTHNLALTSKRDTVRHLIDAAAARTGLRVPMVFEVQSIPALRDIALRGLAACIMPYGTAINELKRGALVGRRIVDPAITRTLYLFRPTGKPAFLNEVALAALIRDMIVLLKDAIGPLARYHPDFRR